MRVRLTGESALIQGGDHGAWLGAVDGIPMAFDSLQKNNKHNDNGIIQSFHRRLGSGIWCVVFE